MTQNCLAPQWLAIPCTEVLKIAMPHGTRVHVHITNYILTGVVHMAARIKSNAFGEVYQHITVKYARKRAMQETVTGSTLKTYKLREAIKTEKHYWHHGGGKHMYDETCVKCKDEERGYGMGSS